MLSDFRRAKLERRFELFDMDGDGYITADDYDEAAANVCRAFDFAQDSPQYEKVHVIYLRLWVALSRVLDEQRTGRISRGQFITSCDRMIAESEEGYDRYIGPIALTVFDLIDADGSGALDIGKLATWFNAYGVCADDAERAFKAVDRNGDGLLSADEVQKAVREFYTSDDPKVPGNLIFGPLPIPAAARTGAATNGAATNGAAGHNGATAKAGPSKRAAKKSAAAHKSTA